MADGGWAGPVVLVRNTGIETHEDGGAVTVRVDAGVGWDDLVARTVAQGWSGLAAMSGIPGLTSATPGAERRRVRQRGLRRDHRAHRARLETGAVEEWDPAHCGLGFRTSAFKHTDVVLDVTFVLSRSADAPPASYLELARRLGVEPGGIAPSARVREVVLGLRASKGMVLDANDHDTWSVGSFFVNPFVPSDLVPDGCPSWEVDERIKLSAAWLIENAGFGKGFGLDRGRGSVALSTKHTLALTNRGDATAAELLDLARVIRDGVQARFGIRLPPEAHLVGADL